MLDTSSDETLDFAISYAGEDVQVAQAVADRLRELTFTVFLADDQRRRMVGLDGEAFLDQLFADAGCRPQVKLREPVVYRDGR